MKTFENYKDKFVIVELWELDVDGQYITVSGMFKDYVNQGHHWFVVLLVNGVVDKIIPSNNIRGIIVQEQLCEQELFTTKQSKVELEDAEVVGDEVDPELAEYPLDLQPVTWNTFFINAWERIKSSWLPILLILGLILLSSLGNSVETETPKITQYGYYTMTFPLINCSNMDKYNISCINTTITNTYLTRAVT